MKHLIPLLLLAVAARAAPVFTAEQTDNEVRILADGKLFTAYVFRGAEKPYVYPLTAPDGVTLNREFPTREVAGETHDHPHHRSFWFTHGDVNGVDFWSVAKGAGTIEVEGKPGVKTAGGTVQVFANCKWVAADSKVIARDESALEFGALAGGERYVDLTVTIRGDSGSLKFGDTKEGSFGLRLLDAFNFKNEKTTARNSAGDDKKTIWSKHAKWVCYETEVNGGPHGVVVFDAPANPKSPTRWHARDYGLLAANPFGEKSFDKTSDKPAGFSIEAGKSATFRYRVILYTGRKNADELENLWQQFSTSPGAKK